MRSAWTTTIQPSQHGGYNAPGSSFGNPIALQTERALYEGPLRKQVEVAQQAFDQALELVLAGEGVKVVSEAEWRKISSQATEPARRAKVRQASERRRAADAENKRQRAEEREAKAKAQAESNGHSHAEVTEEDLHDAAVEENLALARAGGDPDMHDEPAGDEEQDR